MARRLLAYAPDHEHYREVFAGGAALFFRKVKSEDSWINDTHPGLYAFYVALRDHFVSFAAMCRKQKGDLKDIFDYWAGRRDLMSDESENNLVERAVQFYFINRTVWGGRVVYDPRRKSRLYFSNPQGWGNLENKLAQLERVSQKLQGVKLTCLSFEKCLDDLPEDAFVYCDPPYMRDTYCHPGDKLYDKTFNEQHHLLLAKLLDRTPAKVMVSYDDCPQARELYSASKWRVVEMQWKYCGRYAVSKQDKAEGVKETKVDGRELLILNF